MTYADAPDNDPDDVDQTPRTWSLLVTIKAGTIDRIASLFRRLCGT